MGIEVLSPLLYEGSPLISKAQADLLYAPKGSSTASSYTYTAGVLTSFTETIGGLPSVNTLTYTSGVLTTLVRTYSGKTFTTTYTYTAGVLTSTSTVET